MKVTNYEEIRKEVESQLITTDWLILDYLDLDDAILVVCNIYLTNDRLQGFGQDFRNAISVISSPTRISVIVEGSSSFYKQTFPICEYNDLDADIGQILIVLQAAMERYEYLMYV